MEKQMYLKAESTLKGGQLHNYSMKGETGVGVIKPSFLFDFLNWDLKLIYIGRRHTINGQ